MRKTRSRLREKMLVGFAILLFFPPILVWLLGCSVWTLEEDVRSEQLVVVFHTGEFGRARAVRPRIQSELS